VSERARSRWHGMVAEMLLGACAWDRAAQFTSRLDLQAPLVNQSQTLVICGKLITVLRIWEGSSAELFFPLLTSLHHADQAPSGAVAVVGGAQAEHVLQPMVRHPPPRRLRQQVSARFSRGFRLFPATPTQSGNAGRIGRWERPMPHRGQRQVISVMHCHLREALTCERRAKMGCCSPCATPDSMRQPPASASAFISACRGIRSTLRPSDRVHLGLQCTLARSASVTSRWRQHLSVRVCCLSQPQRHVGIGC